MAVQVPYPIDLLLDAAGVVGGARLLDLGGDDGGTAARAAERDVLSSCLIDDCGSLDASRSHYPGIELVYGAVHDIPFSSESFDTVVCHYRMPYFADPDLVIGEAHRVLARGGVFAFTALTARPNASFVPALDHALQVRGGGESPWRGSPHVFTDPYRCARALTGVGFEKVEVRNVPITWIIEQDEQPAEALAVALFSKGPEHEPHGQGGVADADLSGAFEPYRASDGAIKLPMAVIVASGRKA